MAFIYRLKSLSFRAKFSLVTGVFLVFGLIGAVLISQQQQEIRSRASTDITGNYQGDLIGDDYRVAGAVIGNVIGNRNQISQGVQGGIYGSANSVYGNVTGCINGDNNRIAGSVTGGVVGTNNQVTGTKGTGDCPLPGTNPTLPPTLPPTVPPTATPTVAPTLPPTLPPTVPPTRPPTVPPTVPPTSPPTVGPTMSVPPGNTSVKLNLLLHGLGKGGDSANPNSGGNPNPNRKQRIATVEVINSQNIVIATRSGTLAFDTTAGSFMGTVELGTGFTSGAYIIKVKSTQFLKTIIPGIQNITSGASNQLPVGVLANGDIDSNNSINILDYNILIGCYSDLLPPVSCSIDNKPLADLDDDGAVNQYDYNLFLRELTNREGQ
jgi:hypothetical protein